MFELSSLKFTVDTNELKSAISMVDELSTSVNKLKTPLKGMSDAAKDAGKSVEQSTVASTKATTASVAATNKQVKSTDTMLSAIKLYYKEQEQLAKAEQKQKEQMFRAGDSMNQGAVNAYHKFLNAQVVAQRKAVDSRVREMERETKALGAEAKKQQSILERQQAEAKFMARGSSRGEASVLARAEARGEEADIPQIIRAQQTKRSFSGGDTFDKTISGLRNMNQELGQSREGYRQMIAYQKEYLKLQLEGQGKEASLMALNKKETDNLYRDKLRLLEVYKQTQSAAIDSNDPDFVTKVKAQKTALTDLKNSLREVETGYNKVAQIKRPLENIRTVDSAKRRNELNYMARATSVQLGDIGVSLAGGQNPLTVMLQQGDQLRAILGGVGKDTKAMQEVMNSAFTQIITGMVTVGQALTSLVGGAFKTVGLSIVDAGMKLTGFNFLMDKARLGLERLDYNFGTNLTKGFDKAMSAAGGLGSVIRTLAGIGFGAAIAGLIGMALAYKEIIQVSQDLSVALAMSGGAIAINKNEALAMSAAFASTSGTSMQVAGVITEIAKSGNLSRDSIQGITKASLDLEKYGGIAVKDTVALYSKLADDPVKGLTELALKTGDVSQATLDHIEKLVKQGDSVGAVTAAIEEMNRVNGLAAQQMKDDMIPLEVLWSEMKSQLTLLKQEFYELAGSSALVNAFATAWRTVAVVVSEVWFVIKGVGKEIGGLAAQLGALVSGDFKGASSIRGMMVDDAKAARTAQDALTKSIVDGTNSKSQAEKQYITVIRNGHKERREMTAEDKASSIEGIKQGLKFKALADKYNNVSNMSPTGREQAKAAAIKEANALALGSMKAHGADVIAIQKKLAETTANIEEQFKPKKEGKAKKSDAQKEMEDAKKFMDDMLDKSSGKLTTYTEDIAKLNKAKSSGAYTDEQATKAMATYMAKQPEAIELARKQKEITKQNEDALNDLVKELIAADKALTKLNESYANKASEGRFDNEERAKELAFQESLLGYNEKTQREMSLVFEEESRIRKIKHQEIKDLQKAQEDYNEAAAKAPNGVGTDRMNKDLENTKAGISGVAAGAITNVQKATDIEVKKIHIEVTGLDVIANAFSGLGEIMSGFSAQANSELEVLKATIARTGGQYAGMFKDRLKAAEDSAGQMQRATKALGAFGNASKKLADNEKVNAKDDKARFQGQISGYGDMAGAAASYFEEGSDGYNLLMSVQQGFRAAEMAMSVAAMAQKWVETNSGIAANVAGTGPALAKGAAEFFAQSGWAGFVGIAAMMAVMASFGVSGGGGGGTTGAGNQIDATGRKANTSIDPSESAEGGKTNYNSATGLYDKQNAPQKTEKEMIDFANAAAIDAAANAVNNLRVESMKLTKGSEELEQSLMRATIAAGGAGKAQHELATQGMSEAELASYNYNQALRGQISVQMDIANGTENTSENMRKLAGESRSLAIELLEASGDIAGARAMQRDDDTAGYTAAEIAVYDHNQAMRDNIAAMQAGASAAREAEQAEQELAQTRYDLAGRLNVLLGRQTQLQFDRATELAGTTDEASLTMLRMIYNLEDLTTALDTTYAVLERSIAAERKLLEARLKGAIDLQAILKTAKLSSTLEMPRKAAQAQLSMFLATAKASGFLPSAETLKPLLDSIGKPSEDLFSTFEDYQRDFLKTAWNIAEMSGLADEQVSLEQQAIDALDLQLETAKAQLDAIKGVDASVKDVTLAVNDFAATMKALEAARSSTGSFNYPAPATSGGSSSGGGGGAGGTASSGSPAVTFENIAGQDNKEIVAAYREYYNRNPDPTGYKAFMDSKLTGVKLMQAILGASASDPSGVDYKMAVSRGYDPMNPTVKYYLQTTGSGGSENIDIGGSFASGINNVPYDMVAQIHKDERILPAADNKELFARLRSPEDNAAVLAAAVERLTREVEGLRSESRQIAVNTRKTTDALTNATNENGLAFNVVVEDT